MQINEKPAEIILRNARKPGRGHCVMQIFKTQSFDPMFPLAVNLSFYT